MNMDKDSYDESSYPRMADEIGSHELAIGDLEDEVQCPVCTLVLMDPMTLPCGHSFCQLCLARLWQSKSNTPVSALRCPTCRQPWAQVPQVNIQLRNIVESVYRNTMNERRQAVTFQDQSLVADFSRAKVHRVSQDMTPLVKPVLICFLVLGACLALAGVLVVWALMGASGEFMRKPVRAWKSEDVLAWVNGLGEWTQPNITRLFQKQALTGPQLLLVDNHTLIEFGIDQLFRRQTILQAVDQLRAEDYSQPLNFYQFKAAHRRTTLLLVMFYSFWPRFTLLYSYLFEYYTVFLPLARVQFSNPLSEDELSWLQAAVLCGLFTFFPHVGVGVLCVEWGYTHPWICGPMLVHCAITMTMEVVSLFQTRLPRSLIQIRTVLLSVGKDLSKFIVCVLLYHLLWPVIPHFICDLLLYVTLWNTLLAYLIVKPWNLYRRR